MSSKNDCYIISKIFSEFIAGLSESDYECLINGNAVIDIKNKEISSSKNENYEAILNRLNVESYDLLMKELKSNQIFKNKAERIKFCEYLNITILKKHTVVDINNKIINYIKNNSQDFLHEIDKKEEINNSYEIIAQNLDKFMDEKEARDYIDSCKSLSNKPNLIKLAGLLDVYVEKDKTYEDILNKIVSTVVTAKIRSYKIRNKEFNA